jgi:hypothetical protein
MLPRAPIKHTLGTDILAIPHNPRRGSPSLNADRRELPNA